MAPSAATAPSSRRPITNEQREAVGDFLGTFRSTVSSVLLLGWMHFWIVRSVKQFGKEMATMDPLEVVATPFPVDLLHKFVILPVVFTLAWYVKTYGFASMSTISLLYVQLFGLSYALFGAAGPKNMIENYQESVPTAAYVASLLLITSNIAEVSFQSQLPFQLLATGGNAVSFARLYGMISGCVLFGLLSATDKGAVQMQRWPVPVLLGVTYGYVAGSLGGVWLRHYQKNKSTTVAKEKEDGKRSKQE